MDAQPGQVNCPLCGSAELELLPAAPPPVADVLAPVSIMPARRRRDFRCTKCGARFIVPDPPKPAA